MECPFAALKLVTNYLNKDDLVKMMFVNKQWASVLDHNLRQSLRLHFAIRYGKKWTFNGKSQLPDTYMVVLDKRNHKIPYRWGTAEYDLDHTMVGEINMVEESKEADDLVIEDDHVNCIYASEDMPFSRRPVASDYKWFGPGFSPSEQCKFGSWRILEM